MYIRRPLAAEINKFSKSKILEFSKTYYLSRICTFDLVKVWIFPNSTVCTSLLEFLMSCFYSQCCDFIRITCEPPNS